MTVRTPCDDDEIGLITPTGRTDAGHRLYDADALARRYRVSLLHQLGLPLDGVGAAIHGDAADVAR